mmetsp:Transcript_3173/g.6563  ORF Transcript_3173/g.6563 Transcript_3173/m.6563 type:complete len:97 (-) Transcript_3173:1085-1375(-)
MRDFFNFCFLLSTLGAFLLIALAVLLSNDYEYLPIDEDTRDSSTSTCVWAAVFYIVAAGFSYYMYRRLRERRPEDARRMPEIFSDRDKAEIAAVVN